jgi:tetratricopeptide (TPR) repeat protein
MKHNLRVVTFLILMASIWSGIVFSMYLKHPFISGLSFGIAVACVAVEIFLNPSFQKWLNKEEDLNEFNNNITLAKSYYEEGDFLGAYKSFRDAQAILYDPIVEFYANYSLEKLGEIENALWGYRSTCFHASGFYKNQDDFEDRAFLADQYGRAILRNDINKIKQEDNITLNPIEYIDRYIEKPTSFRDDLRMTKALLLLKNHKREEAKVLFKSVIEDSKNEEIKKMAIHFMGTSNIVDNISTYCNVPDILDLEKGLEIINTLLKQKN